MKLEVRSLRVPWTRKRDRLRFFGKTTILNVHETGFTIEGLIPEVWFPILMRFIYRVVSDWSIRSIPFSRIRKCKVRDRRKLRWAICIVWTALLAYLLYGIANRPYLYVSILAINCVVTFFLARLVFKNFVELEYETKDSRRCALRIRFRRASDEMLLFQEISHHRLDVTAPTLADVARKRTQHKGISFLGRNKGVES